MRRSFLNHIYGSAILFLIPSILAVSWINVYLGNRDYALLSYLRTFLVPSVMIAFITASISYFIFAKKVHYTVGKVFFTLFGLLTIFLLIRYGVSFFGLDPIFLTLEITQKNKAAYEIANQYYSFSLPFSLTVTFILYQLGGLLTKSK